MPCSTDCTSNELVHLYPCTQCLSEHQLKAVIVLAFATFLGEEITDVLDCSACLTCMSKHQMLEAITSVLGEAWLSEFAGLTTADVQALIKCLLCATPDQLNAAITYLICVYIKAL